MTTVTGLAGIVVAASGLGLMALAASLVVVPGRAARFLMGFASSARAHFAEQILRLLAGAAFVAFAGKMRFSVLFAVLGWA